MALLKIMYELECLDAVRYCRTEAQLVSFICDDDKIIALMST